MESVRIRFSRRVLVLHVIRGRQIHQIRTCRRLQKLQPRVQREQRQIGGVLIRSWPPHERLAIGEPEFREIGLVGIFGRERYPIHFVGERLEEFVLGGDDGRRDADAAQRAKDRAATQPARVGDHDFFAGLRVEIEIAVDAMNGGRNAGHDRRIVCVRGGWQRRQRVADEAVAPQRGKRRKFAVGDAMVEIFGIESIETNHHGRALWARICAAVHDNSATSAIRLEAVRMMRRLQAKRPLSARAAVSTDCRRFRASASSGDVARQRRPRPSSQALRRCARTNRPSARQAHGHASRSASRHRRCPSMRAPLAMPAVSKAGYALGLLPITSAIPPRMATEDRTRRGVIASPIMSVPAMAVMTGTESCTDAPCAGERPGSAAYQIE